MRRDLGWIRGLRASGDGGPQRPSVAHGTIVVVATVAMLLPAVGGAEESPRASSAVAATAPETEDFVEPWGQTPRLPKEMSPHWVWANDLIFRRSQLYDGDTGVMLGQVDNGTELGSAPPIISPKRGEIYVVQTFYTRGNRGDRFDLVTIYDAETLEVTGDVEIPPQVAQTGPALGISALTDDERFLLVLNASPASSVTVVDLESRSFVEQITAGGCAMIYPAGPRRFGMLCGDGTALLVRLGDDGRSIGVESSAPFFDVVKDPVTVAGARDGATWHFASFEGWLHSVDFSGVRPVAAPPWELVTSADRADEWRIGGSQHMALHRKSRRLFSAVHQGGPGSHKDAGSEIWVWNVDDETRLERIGAPNTALAFIRPYVGFEPGGWLEAILGAVVPAPGVHTLEVTQDDAPLLFARHTQVGAVAVLDALTGRHLRDIEEVGFAGNRLVVAPLP